MKGGVLIASELKKRKYKKSRELEQMMEQALSSRPFYTASELSDYIQRVWNRKYSRSIISRHLCEMGYSYRTKNLPLHPHPPTSHSHPHSHRPTIASSRRIYASILHPLLDEPRLLVLFLDELACEANMF